MIWRILPVLSAVAFGLVPSLSLDNRVGSVLFFGVVLGAITASATLRFRLFGITGSLLFLSYSWVILNLEGHHLFLAALGGLGSYLIYELGFIACVVSEAKTPHGDYQYEISRQAHAQLVANLVRRTLIIAITATALSTVFLFTRNELSIADKYYFPLLLLSAMILAMILYKLLRQPRSNIPLSKRVPEQEQ